MATYTANHLYTQVLTTCISGPWVGEQAVWGLRWRVGRTALDAGDAALNTFDVHTDSGSRSLTAGTVAGTVSKLWVGDAVPSTEYVSDGDVDEIFKAVVACWETTKTFLPNNWKLTHVKMYPVGPDGKAPAGPTTWTPTTPPAGINSSNFRSPEAAVCVSMYSANRSKHGRGRIYIGPVVQLEAADGTIGTSQTTNLAQGLRDCQNAVRTIGTAGVSTTYNGIIWNRSDKTHACTVNLVRCGDELDHQERRTKARPETFTNAVVS